jgi:F0F1-type ATP synthase membrane subunit b/b'
MSDFSRKADESASRLNEKLNSAAQRIEKESAELIEYLNNEVVPAVRQQSSKALRIAAERLKQIATYIEEHKSTGEGKKP